MAVEQTGASAEYAPSSVTPSNHRSLVSIENTQHEYSEEKDRLGEKMLNYANQFSQDVAPDFRPREESVPQILVHDFALDASHAASHDQSGLDSTARALLDAKGRPIASEAHGISAEIPTSQIPQIPQIPQHLSSLNEQAASQIHNNASGDCSITDGQFDAKDGKSRAKAKSVKRLKEGSQVSTSVNSENGNKMQEIRAFLHQAE